MTEVSLTAPAARTSGRSRIDGLARPWQSLAAVPGIGTWSGLGLVVTGLVLVAVAWAVTATQAAVTDQLPVLLSLGGGGLALTVVGVTIVNLVAKRQDSLDRHAQLEQLRVLLGRLTDAEETR